MFKNKLVFKTWFKSSLESYWNMLVIITKQNFLECISRWTEHTVKFVILIS